MYFIAHRGNTNGLNPDKENHPDYILAAAKQGFDVEIDVRYIDGKFYLGHDEPQYEVSAEFLKRPGFWCHAKNTLALAEFHHRHQLIHHFWHQEDDYTLTSKGYIWVYPGKDLINKSIAVIPESRYENEVLGMCDGICSDFIEPYRDVFSKW